MTIELKRRTFLALIGASTAAIAIPYSPQVPARGPTIPTAAPRCFMDELKTQLPVRPKTMAITYLAE
ncbi:MAG: hypothetical protein V5783_10075 [Pontiella sp.]